MHCPYRPQWFQRFRTAVSAYSLQMSRRLKMPRLSSRSSIQWIRVWGVKVTLGYEGKRSRVTRTSDRGGPAHGDRCLSWARSPHHLLRFCRSLFVLLGTCFARIVGALFATKVSFGTSPFGRIVAEISCAAHIENDPN